jgi:mitogen-activated protein kinase kinase
MLLSHPWLKSLQQPEMITEDAEAEDAAAEDTLADAAGNLSIDDRGGDAEVAAWVRGALEKKRKGDSGSSKASPSKPALHAAPLDSLGSGAAGVRADGS